MPIPKHKTILVTGGSRGIGRATALALAGPKQKLVINYLKNEKAAQETAAACAEKGSQVLPIQCDVSDSQAVFSMFDQVEKKLGGVDILVNNAAISSYNMVQDIPIDLWNKTFAVNVHSVFYTSKRALDHMVSQKWGRIINIASIWGLVGASCESLYSACKGAVIAFTKACAKELVYSGITVNCLAPGVVNTDMMANLSSDDLQALKADLPMGRMMEAEEVAYWVKAIADERSASLTGQVISPNGGMVVN